MKGNIAHITSEVFPFFKRGGLGDVMSALPKALAEYCKNYVIAPFYKDEMKNTESFEVINCKMIVHGVLCPFKVYQSENKKVTYCFIELEYSFIEAEGLVRNGNAPYQNNCNPVIFLYFAKALITFFQNKNIQVIVAHDWQSCGVFLYPKALTSLNKRLAIHLVVHNYEFHGDMFPNLMPYLEYESRERFCEMFNSFQRCSLLGLGIHYADSVITVSASYASELSNGRVPHPRLKYIRGRKVHGILNGIDQQFWSPETSPYLDKNFSTSTLETRLTYKGDIYRDNKWEEKGKVDEPIILLLTRLTYQKGIQIIFDLIGSEADAKAQMNDLLSIGFKLVILGAPGGGQEGNIHKRLTFLADSFSDQMIYDFEYSEEKAHRYLAAADILLAPSLFEPCGLVQMYAQSFGVVPVVNPVGGLKETIECYSKNKKKATGFHLYDFSHESLKKILIEAIDVYLNNNCLWREIMIRCMRKDFSWKRAAKQYAQIFFPDENKKHVLILADSPSKRLMQRKDNKN